MEKLGFEKQTKRLVVMTGMLFLAAWPAFGQISYTMTDKHGRLLRQSLREANQVEATTYKETHLNMDAYTLKKGESGKVRQRPMLGLFKAKHDGTKEAVQRDPAVREKKKFRLFRKKEK
ncbi:MULTISPECIES: hypothetical protein [Pontibacter]|uniref:Uncharacterized protein n=1 Tax=Pontibacter lucknowensis TaxID=1077936 RepID=A0A1N6V553_9BACT|nr:MULTISPECIES: hypothetical protein [Pontibacter]EJF08983.1 hypothetical protein O71_17766 [Pontibacter sp. BAB1700]SIQ72950.1 hypothetical protein SAMN05421545_1238 [Pontibacter lucknowensis]